MKLSCLITKRSIFCLLAFLALLFAQPGGMVRHASAEALLCYVDTSASGTQDGSSWESAFSDLQSALGASACTELWVADGTYKPTVPAGRFATFQLKDGVALYGGFAGTELLRDQRDPAANPTILSGDLNGNDAGFTNNAENVYHVVTGANGALLDGFTITAGNANGDAPDNFGGGWFNPAGSPAIANVLFKDNFALVNGGGMALTPGSSPTLTDVTFSGNSAAPSYANGFGGGLYSEDSSPVLLRVTFTGNSAHGAAGRGGGMYIYDGHPTLTDVTFSENTATNNGGGLFAWESDLVLLNVTFNGNTAYGSSSSSGKGGGMYNSAGSLALTNVTFSGNIAGASGVNGWGGGMWNTAGSPVLTNITFSGNSAGLWGGGMYNDAGGSSEIYDSIFWNNTAAVGGAQMAGANNSSKVYDSVIQGGCPSGSACTRILTTDPLLGALGNHGGYTSTIPIQPGSSALDAGNGLTCALFDQRGVARPQGLHCDMGAYEYFTPALSGNAGVADALITYDGGTTSADASGDYAFTVPYGWSGTVTPSRPGYTFSPISRTYPAVTADQTDQDFTAALNTYTISGNAGAADALITYDGGTTIAAASGDYAFSVPYGWSGTVTPSRPGYTFSPISRTYPAVTADQTGQDYTATLNTYTISGNAGVAEALITYDGGTTTADASGDYAFTIPHGWSGTVTPSRAGRTFSPAYREYDNVTADLNNQDYTVILFRTFLALVIR